MALKLKDIIISPVPSDDDSSLTVTLSYLGIGSGKLTGVAVAPAGAFNCQGEDGRPLNWLTKQPLSTAGWSFKCDRVVVTRPDGSKTAPQASITVATNVGKTPFSMNFPPLERPDLRTANATDLQRKLDDLKARVDATADKLGVVDKKIDSLATNRATFRSDLTRAYNAGAGGHSVDLPLHLIGAPPDVQAYCDDGSFVQGIISRPSGMIRIICSPAYWSDNTKATP